MGIKKELSFWQDHVTIDKFASWCGNPESPFKVETRQLIRDREYKTVLDVGAGLFSEYYGFKNDGDDIEYTATEMTPKYVEFGIDQGINVVEASIYKMPFEDGSYECIICHDVLNHLRDTKSAIIELIRVASKEIIISFFKPSQNTYLENLSIYNVQGFPYKTEPHATIESRIIVDNETVCEYVYINQQFLENIFETSEKVCQYKYFIAKDKKVMLQISLDDNITYDTKIEK